MKYQQTIIIHLNIIQASIWGGLARKGLGILTDYDGAIPYNALWANFAACLVLGTVSKVKKTPFIIGVSTGFCGTLSSFSALVLELFYSSANVSVGIRYDLPTKGYGVLQFLSVLLVEMGVSILGYHFGLHLSPMYPLNEQHHEPLSYIGAVLGAAMPVITVVLLAINPLYDSWRAWVFLILFSPMGALLRFHLGKLNRPKFPYGTFTANVTGSILIAVFALLTRARVSKSDHSGLITSYIGCQALSGLQDGLCGALTTISTFVSELFSLGPKESYLYSSVSITVSFVLLLLILGPYTWTVGLSDPICGYS
ncbi:hypothetical protein CANTEDRAFT_109246 [Yamadazyma tenuis ATCC 10573]|uniref:CRCB-domain-containing protein n=1 Tax=Candida tenuis (strain ATCC 10573 / BCRC 21748 / CBS 615 / JCM 9827 / NBRC 10315 / NRRL Y-1498 / VKM Y-70) TaxID=590646 RepID=G3BBM5_CANTC|nr:uncharacterized protein CANTEDRAFT_109246 [Yamadazyma tenuis ATCC 10573]EGV61577.1 hypothetical protein CANTEDRAFT_109246 [Yamadazyma tenuis ATCC 10573]